MRDWGKSEGNCNGWGISMIWKVFLRRDGMFRAFLNYDDRFVRIVYFDSKYVQYYRYLRTSQTTYDKSYAFWLTVQSMAEESNGCPSLDTVGQLGSLVAVEVSCA